MTIQTAAGVKVVIARESTTGTIAAATVTTARVVRIIDTQGLALRRATVESAEFRADGNRAMPRLGGKMVDGSLNTELTVGGAITPLTEGIMRAAYATSVVIGFATMTTIAFGTNYLTAAGGDWVGAQALRVGDVFTVTGADANTNLRTPIVAISSLTITVPAGSFTTLAATATGTITRLRKLVSGATPTRYAYSVEQNEADGDVSEVFLGNRVVGLRMSMAPGQPVRCEWRFMGMDRAIKTTTDAPWFTGHPAVTTGLPAIADDSGIYKSGASWANVTGFDLDFEIAAAGVNVIGSTTPADIFDNLLSVTGSVTGLRSDLSDATTFDAETEFDVCLLFLEQTTAPKPCVGLYLPRTKIGNLSALQNDAFSLDDLIKE